MDIWKVSVPTTSDNCPLLVDYGATPLCGSKPDFRRIPCQEINCPYVAREVDDE